MSVVDSTRKLSSDRAVDEGSASTQGWKPLRLPRWQFLWLTAFVGFVGIRFSLRALEDIWMNDPLQSLGMLLVPVCLLFVLLEWKRRNWEMRGTWWGLPLIGLAYFLSMFHEDFTVYWSAGGRLPISMTPFSLPIFLYVSGLVLLFAGRRLFLQALVPLVLLLMAKPVPRAFSVFFDLPLQHLTAQVARSFATAIGFTPKTPELLLMFSPDFGMFIAPGCDGIRGAATMGYLALMLGYLKRLQKGVWAAYVIGFVLLGYVFNLLRICLLVLYYRIALGHPSWENFAKQADYIIGICLFGVAALVLSDLVLRRRTLPAVVVYDHAPVNHRPTTWMKCAAVLVTLALAYGSYAYASRNETPTDAVKPSTGERMPQQIGSFRLVNTWYETDLGLLRNEGGLYESTLTHHQVRLIVWLPHTPHNLHESWYARGLTADHRGLESMPTSNGEVVFDVGHYRDGNSYTLLMSAMCTPSKCSALRQGKGILPFVFNAPDLDGLANGQGRMISIGIEIQRPMASTAASDADEGMTADSQQFISGLDAETLSRLFQ